MLSAVNHFLRTDHAAGEREALLWMEKVASFAEVRAEKLEISVRAVNQIVRVCNSVFWLPTIRVFTTAPRVVARRVSPSEPAGYDECRSGLHNPQRRASPPDWSHAVLTTTVSGTASRSAVPPASSSVSARGFTVFPPSRSVISRKIVREKPPSVSVDPHTGKIRQKAFDLRVGRSISNRPSASAARMTRQEALSHSMARPARKPWPEYGRPPR